MLILSRYINEKIHIGPDIVVQICDIQGVGGLAGKAKIRIGIEAPREVQILRDDVLERPHDDRSVNIAALKDILALCEDRASLGLEPISLRDATTRLRAGTKAEA